MYLSVIFQNQINRATHTARTKFSFWVKSGRHIYSLWAAVLDFHTSDCFDFHTSDCFDFHT